MANPYYTIETDNKGKIKTPGTINHIKEIGVLDTGWRAISTWGADGVVNGAPLPVNSSPYTNTPGGVYVRRIGPEAIWRFSGIQFTGTANFDTTYLPNNDFFCQGPYVSLPFAWSDGAFGVAAVRYRSIQLGQSGSGKYFSAYNGPVIRFFTTQPWPTTLPGVASNTAP